MVQRQTFGYADVVPSVVRLRSSCYGSKRQSSGYRSDCQRGYAAADTVAANGVHGALLIGKRHAFVPRKTYWQRELTTFEVELCCNSKLVQRGGGSLVLGSPLKALRHLIDLLADDSHNPPVSAGEIISTV